MLATITVNTLDDNTDVDGQVTLREAIQAANTNQSVDGSTAGNGADTITFAEGLAGTITLGGTHLEITDSVTITGPGQDVLTIDANESSRVLTAEGASIDVTLSGLTITGGKTTGSNALVNAFFETTHSGGGIRFLSDGTLSLTDSTLSGNSTAGDYASGGGIFAIDGDVTLTDSTLSGNSTEGERAKGGGIDAYNGDVTLTDSTLSGNSTAGYEAEGGGIFAIDGDVTLTGSTLSGNSTGGYYADGGGISTQSGDVTLTGSTLSGNSTAGNSADGGGVVTNSGSVTLAGSTLSGNRTEGYRAEGGGILTDSGSVTLTGSTLSGNSTAGDYASGGGIFTNSGNVTLTSSTLSGNRVAGYYASGGGVFTGFGNVTLASSTLAGNHAAGQYASGGGIRAAIGLGTLTIHNSIIAGNTAIVSPDFTAPSSPGTNLEVRFSLIGDSDGTGLSDSAPADSNGNLIGIDWMTVLENDGTNPTLADNGGPTQTIALIDVPDNPAIDAGDNTLAIDPGPDGELGTGDDTAIITDQRGSVRLFGASVDVGAFEIFGVGPADLVVTSTDDELLIGDDKVTLRDAIFVANALPGPDTITFAEGVTGTITLGGTHLEITDSVTITGPGQDVLTIDANESSRVLTAEGASIDVTLSGLTITGGKTTGGNERINGVRETTHSGGGIRFLSDGTLSLTDSTLSGNSTEGERAYGGGISTNSGNVTLTDSMVSGNSTTGTSADGGGVFTESGNVTLIGSTLSGNSTASDDASGGGIETRTGNVTLTDSMLSGNRTVGDEASGGGISTNSGNVTLTDSMVSGNSTDGDDAYGGGISTRTGNVTLTDSTLSGNSTVGDYAYGGGIFANFGNVTLTGSTLSGNSTSGTESHGGGISTRTGNVTLVNSTLSGNRTSGVDGSGSGTADGGGLWFDDSVVLIVNSTIAGNASSGAGGGIGIEVDSSDRKLTIHNSIIAGNTANTNPDFTAPANPGTNLEVRFSLIGDSDGTSLSDSAPADSNGNLIGIDWMTVLENDGTNPALADNGGPTQTIALIDMPDNPAIDAGDLALAIDPGPDGELGTGDDASITTDQRGIGFARVIGGTVDIGALEASNAESLNLLVRVSSNETDIVVVDGNNEVARFTAPFDDLAVSGGDQDDTITIADLSSLITGVIPIVINGGGGNDRVILQGAGQTLDATANAITGVEVIDIRGSGNNTLVASQTQIAALTTVGTPLILADPADTLDLRGDVVTTGSEIVNDEFRVNATFDDGTRVDVVGMGWTNPLERADVNGRGGVDAFDALLIINQLASPTPGFFESINAPSRLAAPETLSVPFPQLFYDVSGDSVLSALDALLVINFLGRQATTTSLPEPEFLEEEEELVFDQAISLLVPPAETSVMQWASLSPSDLPVTAQFADDETETTDSDASQANGSPADELDALMQLIADDQASLLEMG